MVFCLISKVFAPHAKIRKLIVPKNNKTTVKKVKDKGDDKKPDEAASEDDLVAPLTWAQRLKRVFNIVITLCPLCGGTMRVITDVTDPDLIQKILDRIAAQPPPVNIATARQP